MLIGEGVLGWLTSERRTDRYGSVLLNTLSGKTFIFDNSLVGQKGTLFTVIKETQESNHFGDLFRGFFPSTPSVGDKIELGSGTLFIDNECIGLRPDDNRDSDWLDPRALYRCHNQIVELHFEPK